MTGPSDMFPVRVLVETVRPAHCLGCAHDGNALVDTFAVVGGQTMLCQLVETVLAALGLPQLVQDSKGRIRGEMDRIHFVYTWQMGFVPG